MSNVPIFGGGGGSATPITDWLTGTVYSVGDYVRYVPGNAFFRCEIAHTAGSDFVIDKDAGRWINLDGYVNTMPVELGGITQQRLYEQLLYNDLTIVGYVRDPIVPVPQASGFTQVGSNLLVSGSQGDPVATCLAENSRRLNINGLGDSSFQTGRFISYDAPVQTDPNLTKNGVRFEIIDSGGGANGTEWIRIIADRTSYGCYTVFSAVLSSIVFVWEPAPLGQGPLVTGITDIGNGEFTIDLDQPIDVPGPAIVDPWQVGHCIMQLGVQDGSQYFVIKAINTPQQVLVEPAAAVATGQTLTSEPSGWMPIVGVELITSAVQAPAFELESSTAPRVPAAGAEIVNKKYVDDKVSSVRTSGIVSKSNNGNQVITQGQFIPIAKNLGRGSAGQIYWHIARDNGVQSTMILSYCTEWGGGVLEVMSQSLNWSEIADVRLRLGDDGQSYVGYVTNKAATFTIFNATVVYIGGSPTIPFQSSGINGTDWDRIVRSQMPSAVYRNHT